MDRLGAVGQDDSVLLAFHGALPHMTFVSPQAGQIARFPISATFETSIGV
jgi:hypothetical protein